MATAKEDGTNFFNSVGRSQADMDAALKKAADNAQALITKSNTQVAGQAITTRYPTQVGKAVDLMVYPYSAVAGSGNFNNQAERGVGMMMERGVGATGCSMNM